MPTMIKYHSLFLLLMLCSIATFAQNTDFQARLIPSVEYQFNKKWKAAAEYRYSLENDLQKFRSSAVQFELKYNITKKLSLDAGYRFTTSYEEDNHRLFAAVQYDHKLKRFTLSSTTKFQFSTNSFDQDFMNYYKEPVYMLREKIALEYNIPKSKLSVFTATEIFLKLDSQPFAKFNRARYSLGAGYDFKRAGKLGVSMFYDDKYSPLKDDRIVLVVKHTLSINDLIGKKEKKKKKEKSDQQK